MTAAWAAAAMLDALYAELARDLDDEYASRQMIAKHAAEKLEFVSAAFHAAADQADDGENIEPYCATCGQWIGIFHGLDGWRHFRGDPAPGGQRELYDPGHPAAPTWCVPPGRALSPAQCRVLGQALADAITYQLYYLGGCGVCGHDPTGTKPGLTAETGQAHACRQLSAALASALPGITGEER
jgi:hypothetical protein